MLTLPWRIANMSVYSLLSVKMTLDSYADVFAGHAKYDYYNWFNNKYKK